MQTTDQAQNKYVVHANGATYIFHSLSHAKKFTENIGKPSTPIYHGGGAPASSAGNTAARPALKKSYEPPAIPQGWVNRNGQWVNIKTGETSRTMPAQKPAQKPSEKQPPGKKYHVFKNKELEKSLGPAKVETKYVNEERMALNLMHQEGGPEVLAKSPNLKTAIERKYYAVPNNPASKEYWKKGKTSMKGSEISYTLVSKSNLKENIVLI